MDNKSYPLEKLKKNFLGSSLHVYLYPLDTIQLSARSKVSGVAACRNKALEFGNGLGITIRFCCFSRQNIFRDSLDPFTVKKNTKPSKDRKNLLLPEYKRKESIKKNFSALKSSSLPLNIIITRISKIICSDIKCRRTLSIVYEVFSSSQGVRKINLSSMMLRTLVFLWT